MDIKKGDRVRLISPGPAGTFNGDLHGRTGSFVRKEKGMYRVRVDGERFDWLFHECELRRDM